MTQSLADILHRPIVVRVVSAALVILGGLCWLVGPGLALFVVPRFKEIFEKFDIPGGLPVLTRAVIAVSDVLVGCWFVFVPLWLLVVGGLAVWAGRAGSRRAWRLAGIFAIIAIIGTSVIVPLMVIGLFLPLVQLIQGVGARP